MSSLKNFNSSSEDYHYLLRDLLSSEFKSSSFNEQNQNFPLYTHNKHTSSYFPTYSHFFIVEQRNNSKEISFFLHGFSLEAKDLIQKREESISKRYRVHLEDENQEKFLPPKDFCLEILNNAGYNEDYFVFYGGNAIFVAQIEDFGELLKTNELTLQIVGSSLCNSKILEIKWVPSTSNHIAVLREDDNFSIYDFGNNIEEPELVIDLSFLDSKKKLLAEQKTFFTDFAFSTNKDGFDCGDFAVFFMNNWGEIYYQCPVIINGMRLPKATVDFLKKRVLHEKKASVAEKELLERITSFLSSIDEFIVEHDAENYQIDAPKVTEHLNLYENVIQGPIKIVDNEETKKSCYRVLFKIPNTFNHIFVRIDQEGIVSILLSPLNIWPNPVSTSKKNLNISSDFQLAVIDKIALNCNAKNNNKNLENLGISKPLLFQNLENKNAFYVLYFNKFFEINIDWINEFDNCFFVVNIENFYKNSISNPNVRLVFDNPENKAADSETLGYFGCGVTKSHVWVFRNKGKDCMIDTVSLNYRIENKKKTNLRLADSLKKETKENSLIKDKKEIEVPQDTLFEIPRILTPDLSNKDKEEKIQSFSDYLNKMKNLFEELKSKLQSKVKKTQKNYLDTLCEKEELEKNLINLEIASISILDKEENIKKKQLNIDTRLADVLEKTSRNSLKSLPNLSFLEQQMYDMEVKLSEIKNKSKILKEKFELHLVSRSKLMNIQLNKENEAKVQEILSINEGLKSKLETIEKQLKKKGKYKN